MILRQLLSTFIFLLCISFLSSETFAKKGYQEKRIEVGLRTIGHQLLLKSGDSNTRVLPIAKDGGRYKIEFEQEFNFVPDSLFHTVSAVIKRAGITQPFIVEVENCKTNIVVYNYEIDSLSQLDFLPCGGREYPKACYKIFFTLKQPDVFYPIKPGISDNKMKPKSANVVLYGIGLLLLLVVGVLVYKKKGRATEETVNPNLITLGLYKFDKRNACLTIHDTSVELSGKEADLLLLLEKNVNQTIERDVILNKVWGDEGDYIGRTLDVFISKLRKKLEADPAVKIVNIRGVGYKLIIEE